jgi:hypothetical protein
MEQILESLPFDDVIVWNNAEREDLGIFGRYAAIDEAKHDVIVTQDDDLIVTCWQQLLDAYEPMTLTVNYPEPWDIPWVARGAIFDRHLPEEAFSIYETVFPRDRDFTHYICDGIFAELTPKRQVIDGGSTDLPWCNDSGRISVDAGWFNGKRDMIPERCAVFA